MIKLAEDLEGVSVKGWKVSGKFCLKFDIKFNFTANGFWEFEIKISKSSIGRNKHESETAKDEMKKVDWKVISKRGSFLPKFTLKVFS